MFTRIHLATRAHKHLTSPKGKKAGGQVVDLFKMTGLAIVWIVPGGAVITAMILKFSQKARPSAFQPEEKTHDKVLLENDIKKS